MIQVGVDVGGSHIAACLYDSIGQQLILDSRSTYHLDPNWEAGRILDTWSTVISTTISYAQNKVAGVGIAIPGPFDYYEGISRITGVNKYECLYGMNIKNELATRLGMQVSQFRFINDASAFAIAVSTIGKAKSFERCLAITLGTGLGASFIINRKPVFSDSQVPEGGFLYNQLVDGVMADDLFSTRGLLHLHHIVSGYRASNALEIYQMATTDSKARETFQLFGQELGRFLSPFVEKFGAEVLVLGGNISNAFEYFKDQLIAELPIAEVHLSGLMDHAALIGGALLMDDEYYGELSDLLKEM
ncbi:ROK family protein [Algoriphagus sp. AGSA1]|uniref:ROK family protein n=1 Tax=Algoriphagus sp. AGSA1 TaxID=2907213 RepID=UPI001F2DBAE2|nr:ROK family protein [Algoriphagus sp. AGSA1]MCE7055247.1 ROK family protein [Algoriphagus sp. AGSA1]